MRKTVLPDIYKKVRNHVQSIINEVVYKFSFSIDFWTLQSANAFISFAIHFLIDLWEQKVVTLERLPLDDQHTAANITDEIQALLHDWNLFNKIHIAVTDNGSNLVNALTDADLTRVPCAIHTLQLVIGDCKDVQQGVNDLLTKASSMVSHFRNSVKAAEMLRAKQRELGIDQTVLQINQQTRWNSEYNMLHSIHVNKKAIKAAVVELRFPASQRLNENDRNTAVSLIELLKPFRTATLEFERDSACISQVIPRLLWIGRQLQKVPAVSVQAIRSALLDRMKFRFYNEETTERTVSYNIEQIDYYSIATTLDPRFRQKYFKSAASGGCAIDGIKDIIGLLEDNDIGQEVLQHTTVIADPRLELEQNVITTVAAPAASSSWAGLDDDSCFVRTTARHLVMSLEEEIEMYLKEENISFDESPFKWWRENEKRFPRLAKVAKSFLSAPAGNQSLEAAFLMAKNICGGNRGRLLPENTRMLHFLRCNLPAIGYNSFRLPPA